MRMLLAAAVLLFGLAACGSAGSTTTGGPGPVPATSAPPTDAAGKPIVRPRCAESDLDTYLHATGPTNITPVLMMGSGPRGVVVGGQANGGICQLLPFARTLVAQGYHVAVFDWREPYAEAMATAARVLLEDGATRVALGGFSRGALVALGVAKSVGPAPVGVFSVSGGPSASEGFPTIASLSTYAGPILLIMGKGDAVFPQGTTEAIAAAHEGDETVLIVPGSAHALALLADGDDGPPVRAALDDFLARVLA
jgi:pimeloyl-ACP methyl ester carboxylesterase